MHPYLVRLGIPLAVQNHFEPYWRTDDNGALLFDYGDEQEHFGLGFHRLPAADSCWLAGETGPGIRHIFICNCAMEAISFLALNHYRLPDFDRLLFIATGGSLTAQKLQLPRRLALSKISVIHENSLLGHLIALKIAAGIRRQPVQFYALPENRIQILFRHQHYAFEEASFSMSRFEKASDFRFRVRCEWPAGHLTFLDQLKAGPFIPNL